jgi:hypothetical protein
MIGEKKGGSKLFLTENNARSLTELNHMMQKYLL